MAPPKLYVAYTGNSVGIDPSFGRGPTKELALETVGDLIEAFKAAVTPELDHVSITKLSLYLPGDVGLKSLDLARCFRDNGSIKSAVALKTLVDAGIGLDEDFPLIIKSAAGKVSLMRDVIRKLAALSNSVVAGKIPRS
jgi:hypothetical protein